MKLLKLLYAILTLPIVIIGFIIGYILYTGGVILGIINKIKDYFRRYFSIIFRKAYIHNRNGYGLLITYDDWRDGPRSGLCIYNFGIYRYDMDEIWHEDVNGIKTCGCSYCDCVNKQSEYRYFIVDKSNEYKCNECGYIANTLGEKPHYCNKCGGEREFIKSK